jgi:hypothetical protein
MSLVMAVRVPDDTGPRVDRAAAAAGMTRSAWLAAVIDRGLVGAGQLTTAQAAQRRDQRAALAAAFTPGGADRAP